MLLLDTLLGLTLVGTLAVVFTVAMTRQHRAENRLADRRDAMRAAEAILTRLQGGEQLAPQFPEMEITAARATASAAPAGHVWVRVSVRYRAEAESLVGLAPDNDAIPTSVEKERRP